MLSDPNLLPGIRDVAAPDSSEGAVGAGYLWDAALRHGLTIRNYGFYLDLIRYQLPSPFTALNISPSTTPFTSGSVQSIPANAALAPYTDPYFRGFDNAWPDFYRYQEWGPRIRPVRGGRESSRAFVRTLHARSHGQFRHRAIRRQHA